MGKGKRTGGKGKGGDERRKQNRTEYRSEDEKRSEKTKGKSPVGGGVPLTAETLLESPRLAGSSSS